MPNHYYFIVLHWHLVGICIIHILVIQTFSPDLLVQKLHLLLSPSPNKHCPGSLYASANLVTDKIVHIILEIFSMSNGNTMTHKPLLLWSYGVLLLDLYLPPTSWKAHFDSGNPWCVEFLNNIVGLSLNVSLISQGSLWYWTVWHDNWGINWAGWSTISIIGTKKWAYPARRSPVCGVQGRVDVRDFTFNKIKSPTRLIY